LRQPQNRCILSAVERLRRQFFFLLIAGLVLAGPVLRATEPPDPVPPAGEVPAEVAAPAEPTDAAAPTEPEAPAEAAAAAEFEPPAATGEITGVAEAVLIIPVHGPIASPNLYVLRRGLKQAIESGVRIVVIDLDTPGGSLGTMLEMMEAVHRFDGRVVAFINPNAGSAGAYLAMVCDEVWFHPEGIIGAAAMVTGTGEDVPETMRLKMESYIGARVRAYLRNEPFRAKLLRAMADSNYVLEIDGETIKPAGELLTLTADEALKTYGDPPRPLLAAGIAPDVTDLLAQLLPGAMTAVRTLEVTWAERVAQFLNLIAPILLGIAFLLISIEFKTPGWGIFGTLGIILLVGVFLSNYVAGLAGYEPLLLCGLGLLLVVVELFILPGIGILLILGMIMIGVSVVWSLADLWPGVAPDGTSGFSWSAFGSPIIDLALALVVFVVGLAIIFRFMPKTSIFSRLVLAGGVADANPVTSAGGLGGATELPAIGTRGIAVSDLHPGGEVEIDGQRFEAVVALGSIARRDEVVVTGYRNLGLEVARPSPATPPPPSKS